MQEGNANFLALPTNSRNGGDCDVHDDDDIYSAGDDYIYNGNGANVHSDDAGDVDRHDDDDIHNDDDVHSDDDGDVHSDDDDDIHSDDVDDVHSDDESSEHNSSISENSSEATSAFEPNDTRDTQDSDDNFDSKTYYENWIMFESSNISVWEVFNMIQAMSRRFKFSGEVQQSVLEFTKILAGPKFENFNTTKYSMNKIYNPPDDRKTYVFFCPVCNTVLHDPIEKQNMTNKTTAICEKCSKNYLLTMSSDNYFISVDLAYQIRLILENEEIERAIKENVHQIRNQSSDANTISDVYSSSRYMNCDYIAEKQDNNVIVLTLNVNIDGAPLFNTSKRSLWPIQAIINEIPVKLRHSFFLLAALWLTSSEPNPDRMNIYLKFFVKQIMNMMNEGLMVTNNQGETTIYYVTVFCFPVDTPARAVLQNRIRFNGYYGCSWCYEHGVYTEGAMKYPLNMEDPYDRSHSEYLKDIHTFENFRSNSKNPEQLTKRDKRYFGKQSRGSTGSSELTALQSFDCIWGFPCEYLHSVLLGAAKQQWEEWANAKSNVYLTPSQRAMIDERLVCIQPPNEMHRLPRCLADRANWRGSEWRSWLLFYSVACLMDFLPDEVLKSYMLLVRATYILLRTDITEDDLIQCEIDIIQYVGDCQKYYGNRFMTFNIHSLLHLSESVRQNGCLWATSAFPFESQIGQLKKVVTGPKGVVDQISNRMLQSLIFQTLVIAMPSNKESWRFCKRVYDHRPLLKHYRRTKEGAILAGIVCSDQPELTKPRYNRCVYRNAVYHSTSYTRPKKINNTIIELIDETVLEIQHFSVIDEVCLLVCKKWETTPLNRGTELKHMRVVTAIHEETMTISITEIKRKLLCMKIPKVAGTGRDAHVLKNDPNVYVCSLPNTLEVQ